VRLAVASLLALGAGAAALAFIPPPPAVLDPMIAGPEGGRHPICNGTRVERLAGTEPHA